MIVFDASAAVLALLNDGDARRSLATDVVAVPHLADAEVVSAVRAQVLHGNVTADARLAHAPGLSCAITLIRR